MTTVKKGFVYIWEYLVKEEHQTEFENIYGPEGEWVQLFRKAEGYITTDLHQDISNTNRFITVDFWNTKKDRDSFRKKYSKEFELLDEHCELFTNQEKLIGDFDTIVNRL